MRICCRFAAALSFPTTVFAHDHALYEKDGSCISAFWGSLAKYHNENLIAVSMRRHPHYTEGILRSKPAVSLLNRPPHSHRGKKMDGCKPLTMMPFRIIFWHKTCRVLSPNCKKRRLLPLMIWGMPFAKSKPPKLFPPEICETSPTICLKWATLAFLLLDDDLRIRNFSTSVQQHFVIEKEDTGTYIGDFEPRFFCPQFMEWATEVNAWGVPKEAEIENDDNWYLMRIYPYAKSGKARHEGRIGGFCQHFRARKVAKSHASLLQRNGRAGLEVNKIGWWN